MDEYEIELDADILGSGRAALAPPSALAESEPSAVRRLADRHKALGRDADPEAVASRIEEYIDALIEDGHFHMIGGQLRPGAAPHVAAIQALANRSDALRAQRAIASLAARPEAVRGRRAIAALRGAD